jgi:hypothetical protein
LRAEAEIGTGESGQQVAAIGRLGQQQGGGRGQELAAEFEFGLAMAVGREAVVANPLKVGRDGGLQEAVNELFGVASSSSFFRRETEETFFISRTKNNLSLSPQSLNKIPPENACLPMLFSNWKRVEGTTRAAPNSSLAGQQQRCVSGGTDFP